jgi:acyl-CoA hydrolase
MKYYSRRMVKYQDLNPAHRLFGGALLAWIDEEAAIFATCQLDTPRIVTKFMSEINFVAPAEVGDIVEFGLAIVSIGTTSLTVCCNVRNKHNKQTIINVERIVFVCVDENGNSQPHGKTMASINPNDG